MMDDLEHVPPVIGGAATLVAAVVVMAAIVGTALVYVLVSCGA